MDATQDNSKKGADPKSAPGTVTAAPQRTPIPAVQPANTNMTTVANITTTERAPLNAYDGVGITCCGVEVCASSSPSTDWGWFVFVVVFFALVFAFVCAILWIVNGRGDSGAGVGAPGSV
ncbi:hypothetical protein UCRPA7_5002 [Phaeoacremonium minimum UCRPA7]|uniref:Transmembrane protein n=1 Tax=Phaeoacremonium minimum (strain UCR-PA7) TaxID=1286976 RepID=R8BJS5_PHAM7|nr:hypothetical protein UCRPA7_5002 [Phaeoacremonium minimum UCRPA7]EON99467.1 hypothetical protein UCRPA7_5002 [Phaeoacremonium minimum UCRPA7]